MPQIMEAKILNLSGLDRGFKPETVRLTWEDVPGSAFNLG
jgi:hypothetical protein